MSTTEAIGKSTTQSVGFESVERDEERVKGLALDAATLTHFNGVKDALMEVARADSQRTQTSKRPAAKNNMVITFEIMKLVMETLRNTSDSSKEMNKLLKKEWKAVANKQSDNNKSAKENVEGSAKWQYFSLAGSQSKIIFEQALLPFANAVLRQQGGVRALEYVAKLAAKKDTISKFLEGAQSQFGSALGKVGESIVQMEQYNVGIKGDVYNHHVQTHSSEYQTGSQQHSSDKQAHDNAADTNKQLIRIQGEILMGKA